MLVYITGTLISVLLAYISTHIENTGSLGISAKRMSKNFFAIFSVMPLLLIMAFRYNVGTDYMAYRYSFFHQSGNSEIGYNYLTIFLNKITSDPQSIFVVSSVVICGFYFLTIYKESVDPVYSILLFVLCKDYFISMNGLRQYMATAIALLAIPFAKKHEWIKTVIIILIAASFHKSAIVFLIIFILSIFDISPVVGTMSIGIIYGLATVVRSVLFPVFQKYGFYDVYFSMEMFSNREQVFNLRYFLIFVCFFIFLSYEYKEIKQSKELRFLYYAVLFSLAIISVSSMFPTVIARLTWHMNSFLVLYIPLAIKKLDNKYIRGIMRVSILTAFAFVTISELLEGNQDVLPYRTIWS